MAPSLTSSITVQVGRFEPSYAQRQLCERMRSPEALFPATYNHQGWRYCYVNNHKTILLQTDGACSDNGAYGARAGAAYIYGPPNMLTEEEGTFEFRSRRITPRPTAPSSLRIVVATDSEYVVRGCTEWVRGWVRRGWRTASYGPVKNQDLWEMLLGRIEWLQVRNCQVLFWKIPRAWNRKADAAAKRAAALSTNV